MPRTLLLCFLHGFKGNDDTFHTFPEDLRAQVAKQLPLSEEGEGKGEGDAEVRAIVYPQYETKGELAQCSAGFLSWLKERVMEVRKERCEKPWPANDRDVGVILVAHSMGGFVASDTLMLILDERHASSSSSSPTTQTKNNPPPQPLFPPILGILTFDTPFNGLARSMFVYGAFSNYQKVSAVFNVMTALSAAPAALGKKVAVSASSSSAAAAAASSSSLPSSSSISSSSRGGSGNSSNRSSSSAWKGWQLLAVRTGTVGAIAAGGVAAYMHRQQIMSGVRGMRNLNRESVKEGYQQSVDTISQGLAYINRGNVGRSFEYLSDHFTFVGTLLKQKELARRLERMALLKGIGIHDYYTSLGENGMWSGGYFVPERTFCAVPAEDHPAHHLFSRRIIRNVDDEVQAHMSMFVRDKNDEYVQMTQEASNLVVKWFVAKESEIVDDPKFAEEVAPKPMEQSVTATTPDGQEIPKTETIVGEGQGDLKSPIERETLIADAGASSVDIIPDESPLDITAAAAAIPLPDDDDDDNDDSEAPSVANAEGRTYMRYLMGIAQQAGTGVRSYVPTKMPEMPSGPSFKSFVPRSMPAIPSIPRPSVNLFGGKKQKQSEEEEGSGEGKEERGGDTQATAAAASTEVNRCQQEQQKSQQQTSVAAS